MAAYLENVNKQPVEMWKGQLSKFVRFFQKLPPFIPKHVSEISVSLINVVFRCLPLRHHL